MIFISYSWGNRRDALDLSSEFRASKLPYWLDSERLDLSRSIASQLSAAISYASVLLVVSSPASQASPWVAFELRLAKARDLAILCATPDDLRNACLRVTRLVAPDPRSVLAA